MLRNFICPESEEPCSRPECTTKNCGAQREQKVQAATAPLSPEEEELERHTKEAAVRFAKDVLRKRGLSQTADRVAEVAAMPKVRQAARERAREEIALLKSLGLTQGEP